ncbi:MAG: M12 family metallopeptidase [Acidobacteriota bacterium]
MQLSNSFLTVALGLALLLPATAAEAHPKEQRHARDHAWTGAEEAFPGKSGTPRSAILVNADGSQGDVIDYIDYDGAAIYGGDIAIHVEHGYAAFQRSHLDQAFGTKSAGRTAPSRLWPSGLVPYTVESGVSSTVQGWIADAIDEWASQTEVRLVPRTNEADYLYFSADSACGSYVGRQGGSQQIWVNGCSKLGSVVHEIGHAVGLYHEHSRADRDFYVTINWSNIDPGYVHNFSQYTAADGADLGDYDYGSIMHYSCTAGSINGGQTISPRHGAFQCNTIIGQRDGFSDGDLAGIHQLYPQVTVLATNYSGQGQGNKLYQIDGHDASTSQTRSLRGATCVSDMDFMPGSTRVFGVDCSDPTNGAGSTVVEINFKNGSAMPRFTLPNGREATSVAMAPDGSYDMYVIDQQGKGWGNQLYKVNTRSRQVTDIGTLSGSRNQATSIAFNEDGTLYAIDNTYNNGAGAVLFTIDTTTALTSTIGWMGGDRTHATSIRFGSGGTLYGINNNGNGRGKVLFLIDTDDASTRDIATLSGEQSWATSLATSY